jgi:hypothetical protein
MQQNLMHVVGLSAEEQVALKLILSNYTKMLVKAYMMDASKLDGDERAVVERWRRVCYAFDTYDVITSTMPSLISYSNNGAKPQLFRFLPKGIKTVLQAIDAFDSNSNAGMEVEEVQVVEAVGALLREKFVESSKYYYTNEEIQKEWKRR